MLDTRRSPHWRWVLESLNFWAVLRVPPTLFRLYAVCYLALVDLAPWARLLASRSSLWLVRLSLRNRVHLLYSWLVWSVLVILTACVACSSADERWLPWAFWREILPEFPRPPWLKPVLFATGIRAQPELLDLLPYLLDCTTCELIFCGGRERTYFSRWTRTNLLFFRGWRELIFLHDLRALVSTFWFSRRTQNLDRYDWLTCNPRVTFCANVLFCEHPRLTIFTEFFGRMDRVIALLPFGGSRERPLLPNWIVFVITNTCEKTLLYFTYERTRYIAYELRTFESRN